MKPFPNSEHGVVPPPPSAYPPGDPRSVIYYVETFEGIVETGITGQVFAFWIGVIRTELGTVVDETVRAEAMRLLQDVDKVGAWFSHEAQHPGEALPMILSPIRKLLEYLRQPTRTSPPVSPAKSIPPAPTPPAGAARPNP